MALVCLFPLVIWVKLWKTPTNDLSYRTTKDSFGTTYSDLKSESKGALLYNVLFMLRRLFFVALAIFALAYPLIQYKLLIFHCLALMTYLLTVYPFDTPYLNRLELFNEISILLASMHLLALTDFNPDPEV